jgi:serine/threonine protein kinase
VKLLLENWRKFVNEEETATMDMGGKSWNQVELDKKERAKQGAEDAGFYFDRKLGKGMMGEVYLVENKKTGERNAMKHVVKSLYGGPSTSKREAQNYRFAMDNKASMNQKFAKYLPDVYNVIETTKDYFIFMELLEDIPDRVKADILRLNDKDSDISRHEKYTRLFKDTEAIYEVVNIALHNNLMLLQGDRKVYEDIKFNVPNAVMKRVTEMVGHNWEGAPWSTLADLIVEESMKYLEQDSSYYESTPRVLKQNLEEVLQDILEKQIVPIHGGHGRVSAAGKHGEKVERNFPEAIGLMRAMKYFHERENWQPKDVHSGNVMVRPGTKNFVITDLGLFDLKSV